MVTRVTSVKGYKGKGLRVQVEVKVFQVQEVTEYRVQSTGYRYKVQGKRNGTQSTGYRVQATGYRVFA